jgi:hypothetical protein
MASSPRAPEAGDGYGSGWYRWRADSAVVAVKILSNSNACHAGIPLAKMAGRVLYMSWASGRPPQRDTWVRQALFE